jgi:hypothetical protein
MINRDAHHLVAQYRSAKRQERLALVIIAACLAVLIIVFIITLTACGANPLCDPQTVFVQTDAVHVNALDRDGNVIARNLTLDDVRRVCGK